MGMMTAPRLSAKPPVKAMAKDARCVRVTKGSRLWRVYCECCGAEWAWLGEWEGAYLIARIHCDAKREILKP